MVGSQVSLSVEDVNKLVHWIVKERTSSLTACPSISAMASLFPSSEEPMGLYRLKLQFMPLGTGPKNVNFSTVKQGS
jgi:hypothetical protein